MRKSFVRALRCVVRGWQEELGVEEEIGIGGPGLLADDHVQKPTG
jgi:hypothetical protein